MFDLVTVKINGVWVQRPCVGFVGSAEDFYMEPSVPSDSERKIALADMECKRHRRGGRKRSRRRKGKRT